MNQNQNDLEQINWVKTHLLPNASILQATAIPLLFNTTCKCKCMHCHNQICFPYHQSSNAMVKQKPIHLNQQLMWEQNIWNDNTNVGNNPTDTGNGKQGS